MKNENASVKKSANTKKAKEVTKVNLQSIAERLQKVDVKEKRKKETIYIYPEGFTEQKINSEEGKKFRNKLRNAIKRFANNIFVYAKINDADKLKKEIALFKKFYKDNYRINDLSLQSISNSQDKDKVNTFQLMLDIIKQSEK